jgi:electron transfer DM13
MSMRRGIGVLAVVAAVALVGGLLWARPWQRSQTASRESAQVKDTVPGPYTDDPTPSEAAQLLYSTRTWKSYRHQTTGFVELYRPADGGYLLRLADLSAPAATGETVRLSPQGYTSGDFRTGGLDLGPLKGLHGSANYPVPTGTDLSRYTSVVIWDSTGAAPLSAAPLVTPAP